MLIPYAPTSKPHHLTAGKELFLNELFAGVASLTWCGHMLLPKSQHQSQLGEPVLKLSISAILDITRADTIHFRPDSSLLSY